MLERENIQMSKRPLIRFGGGDRMKKIRICYLIIIVIFDPRTRKANNGCLDVWTFAADHLLHRF